MIERITLLNLIFLPDESESRIKATASISVDNIRFFNLQVIQKDGKPPFVRFPSWKHHRDANYFEFRRYYKLPVAVEQKIEELILSEYKLQRKGCVDKGKDE